jgi:hypothetical protein
VKDEKFQKLFISRYKIYRYWELTIISEEEFGKKKVMMVIKRTFLRFEIRTSQ